MLMTLERTNYAIRNEVFVADLCLQPFSPEAVNSQSNHIVHVQSPLYYLTKMGG